MKDVFAGPLTEAVEQLHVPPVNFAAIAQRATTNARVPRRRRRVVWLTLAVLIPAVAAAAVFRFVPFQLTHKFGMWQVYGPSYASKMYWHPTSATLVQVARLAPYRVIWPVGIPKSNPMENLDSEASQLFFLLYPCPGSLTGYSSVAIIPKNYAPINPNLGKWFDSQTIPHGRVLKFAVGEELMLLESTCLTSSEMQRVKTATIATGAAP